MHAGVEFGFGLAAYHRREVKHRVRFRRECAFDERRIGEITGVAFDAWIGHRRWHDIDQDQLFHVTARAAGVGELADFENAAGEAAAKKSRSASDHYAHPKPPVVTASPSRARARIALHGIIRYRSYFASRKH